MVVLGVLVLVGGGWSLLALLGRHQVEATWSAPVRCTGAEVRTVSQGGARIDVRPGMRCVVSTVVRNDGWWPVTVERLDLPGMGPRGGVPARLLDGAGDVVAGQVSVEERVGPGSSLDVESVLVFREGACATGTTTFVGFPGVRVSSLALPGDLRPPESLLLRGVSDDCSP